MFANTSGMVQLCNAPSPVLNQIVDTRDGPEQVFKAMDLLVADPRSELCGRDSVL